jgi:replicative DNA helicase
MALYSIQIEKHVLGGLIQNPDVISDIDRFLTERDFVAEPHNVIFSCLRTAFLANEKIDRVLLAQKIKNLGIAFKDDINIFDYIDAISFTPITPDATFRACQELVKLRSLRDIEGTCDEMKIVVGKSINQPLDTTIAEIDALYGQQMNAFELQHEPTLLFEDIHELVEERGNNPVQEIGLATPYPEFNRLYGGLRNKNLYIVASRAKSGKTTWLDELCCEVSRIHQIPVLILDTEMASEEVKFRVSAAKANVGLWFLETGNWRRDEDMVQRVRTNLSDISKNYKVYHMSIGNKKVSEVSSICRRWYLKVVGRGNKCLICYDYIKMVDKLDKNQQEYQLMGEKVDALKKLSEELNCPIVTAVQSNRIGITNNRDSSEIIDDESTIGISDRITWYATYVGILRRKTPDEIALDTPESGTHKLIEAVARFQGRDAAGHQDYIRRRFPDGKTKFVKNYINFQIFNFRVEERGSLRDSIARQNSQFLVQDNTNEPVREAEIEQDTL